MRKIAFILCLCLSANLYIWSAQKPVVIKANSNSITYTGRTETLPDGSVRYDWVGVYLQTYFTGGSIAVRISETKYSYYNVFIDNNWIEKIKFSGKDTLITLAHGLTVKPHLLKLQKCTEGERGCTTIHQFVLASNGTLKAVPRKSRMIEVYGDSYTCGYGNEATYKDHFKVETENCEKSYATIIARYFDADYSLIAHSGRGMVRNYGDTARLSKNTMYDRSTKVYDSFNATTPYDFKAYRPNIVLINLGANDFSRGNIPTDEEYIAGYKKMIKQLREIYGNVSILCIIPHSSGITSPIARCLMKMMNEQEMKEDKNLYLANLMYGELDGIDDTGADGHPNYSGDRKIAMKLIPRISTIMHWPLEDKVIK
jgi:lysophospholipase L1-like esterase